MPERLSTIILRLWLKNAIMNPQSITHVHQRNPRGVEIKHNIDKKVFGRPEIDERDPPKKCNRKGADAPKRRRKAPKRDPKVRPRVPKWVLKWRRWGVRATKNKTMRVSCWELWYARLHVNSRLNRVCERKENCKEWASMNKNKYINDYRYYPN